MTPEEQTPPLSESSDAIPTDLETPIRKTKIPEPSTNPINTVAYIISLITVFLLGFMLAGAIGFDLGGEDTNPDVAAAVQATFQALTPPPPTPVPLELTYSENDYVLGAEDAPITLVEFSDYRCPYCGHFEMETLAALMEHYDGYVKFVYRDYPIFGDESVWASIAAQCAEQQGMFWEFHHAIFESQAQDEPLTLDNTSLTEMATELSMDEETFAACLADDSVTQGVVDNIQTAYELLGQAPTPTFLLNGKRFSGALPFNDFVQIINSELEALGVEPPAL